MIVRSGDGTLIYGESHPAKNCKGALLVVHGLGEHSGRYKELVAQARRLGLDVHLLDLRGHGRSQGIRGHFQSMEELHGDIDAWMKHLVDSGALHADRPCYLLGHSLGGLVALTFAARYTAAPLYPPLAGLLLSAPAVGLRWRPLRLLESKLARTLPKLFRSVHVPSGILSDQLTHDPVERERFDTDPLVHRWITPAAFHAMERAMAHLPRQILHLGLPMLFLLSGRDRVVDTSASLAFAKKLAVAHPGSVEVRVFHTFFHEPFHETKRDRAFLELKKWVLKQRSSRQGSSKSSGSEATGKATSRSHRAAKAHFTST